MPTQFGRGGGALPQKLQIWDEILKAADWSSESVFQKSYHKPTDKKSSYGRAVVSDG